MLLKLRINSMAWGVAVAGSLAMTILAVLVTPSQTRAPEKATPSDTPVSALAKIRENPEDALKYVWIPPATFQMGCSPGDNDCDDDEKPRHSVTITKGFWMGQTPVTVGAYKRFVAATGKKASSVPPFKSGWTSDDQPIVHLTWEDSRDFCAWSGGRLPTEAEWEYAARGGSAQARYGELDEIAWYGKNSGGHRHGVAQKRANGFGLFDMLGDVNEWVNDWYDPNYYQTGPSVDPPGPPVGQQRALRGVSSFLPFPGAVRVSLRGSSPPYDWGAGTGFRCVMEKSPR